MQMINRNSSGKVISIHNQETIAEDDMFVTGKTAFEKMFSTFNIDTSSFAPSGKTSLQTYLPELNKANKLILVHNTFTSESDVEFAQQSFVTGKPETGNWKPETYFCLCPNANLYIENTLPPVDLLRGHGRNIVLGTDSLASNDMLCILSEIKTLRENFPHIPLEEMLQWATLDGAKALEMDSLLGSFEKGKRPGILAFDGELNNLKRLI
jgi:cytosine/adenosine deaminase-related metal-dependent hydrolase